MIKTIKFKLKKCMMVSLYKIDPEIHPSDAYKIVSKILENEKTPEVSDLIWYITLMSMLLFFSGFVLAFILIFCLV